MQGVEYMKTNFAKACFLQCIFCLTKIYPDAGIVKRYALITQKVILASYWAIYYKCDVYGFYICVTNRDSNWVPIFETLLKDR